MTSQHRIVSYLDMRQQIVMLGIILQVFQDFGMGTERRTAFFEGKIRKIHDLFRYICSANETKQDLKKNYETFKQKNYII